MKKGYCVLLTVMPFIAVALFWWLGYGGHIWFWEGSNLFLNTESFLDASLRQSGGLSRYAGTFLTLFFQWKIIGAIILTLPIYLVYRLSRFLVDRFHISTGRFLYCWVPPIFLFLLQLNHTVTLSDSIQIVFFYAFAALYVVVEKNAMRYALFILIFGLCSLLLTPGACFLSGIFFLSYELLYGTGFRRFWFLIGWFLLCILVPLARQWYLVLFPDEELYELFRPTLFSGTGYLVPVLYGWPIAVLLLSLLSRFRFSFFSRNEHWVSFVVLLLFLGGLYPYTVHRDFEVEKRADEAVCREDWDRVLDIAQGERYPSRELLFMATLALSQKGELPEKLFDYPISGILTLSPTREFEYSKNLYAGEFYARLGILNEAIHRYFQASSDSRFTIDLRTLRKLAELNIRNGLFLRGEKYLKILKRVPFQQPTVKHLRKLAVTERERNVDRSVRQPFFVGTSILSVEMFKLHTAQPENRMAKDYLLCSLLLLNDLDRFAYILPVFYPAEKTERLPRVYEEAVCALVSKGDSTLSKQGYTIDVEMKERYERFRSVMENERLTVDQKQEQLNSLRNSWWYYDRFGRTNEADRPDETGKIHG